MTSSVAASSWIRRFHPAPGAPARLVCLPHAGGSASYFFPVSRSLSDVADVLAVQYPGRQDRRNEPCVEDLHELADQIFAVLRTMTDLPLTLFGHSMGAVLAFEIARRFEATGVVPANLILSGRRAPSQHRDEKVHLRDDEGLLADVKALNGTESGVFDDDELLRMVLPAIRSDYKAIETYQCGPGPAISCPMSVLVGNSDPKVTVEEARAWSAYTTGAFELEVFSGGHFFLNNHGQSVIARIRAGITGQAGV
ncbi:MAG: thioesterase [Kutzneria sp.]|nr:thioesterase [Kutzneria sp.]MBV9847302.1 thioesterase [Kutzneria sp.]